MEHWLDKKIKELSKEANKALSVEDKTLKENRIIANFEKNKEDIEAFINKLKDYTYKI